jgi:hypothetical protein
MTPTIQSNVGRVILGDPAHVSSSPAGQLTADKAKEWATAHMGGLISANPSKFQNQAPVMTTITDCGIYVKTNQESDMTGQPEANYSHGLDTKGNIVRRFISRWNVYITQPDSAWATKHLADLQAMLVKYPWLEFFFMDSAGNYSYTASVDPIKPGTKTKYTMSEWLAMLKKNIDAWNAAVPLKHRVINGLQPETVDLYTPCVGQIEAAFGSLDGVLPTEAEWGRLFDQVWQAQAKQWTPWLFVKMRGVWGDDNWNRFRALTLPSAMLMDRGSLLYCILGIEGDPPSWVTGEYKHPWYNPDIGMPLPVSAVWTDMRTPSGAYLKPYDRGVVIVNPTTAGVRVDLPEDNSVAVDAQSGTILRENTVTTWEPVV